MILSFSFLILFLLCLAPSLCSSPYTTLLRADIPELNLALPASSLSLFFQLTVVEPERLHTELLVYSVLSAFKCS